MYGADAVQRVPSPALVTSIRVPRRLASIVATGAEHSPRARHSLPCSGASSQTARPCCLRLAYPSPAPVRSPWDLNRLLRLRKTLVSAPLKQSPFRYARGRHRSTRPVSRLGYFHTGSPTARKHSRDRRGAQPARPSLLALLGRVVTNSTPVLFAPCLPVSLGLHSHIAKTNPFFPFVPPKKRSPERNRL